MDIEEISECCFVPCVWKKRLVKSFTIANINSKDISLLLSPSPSEEVEDVVIDEEIDLRDEAEDYHGQGSQE